MLSPFDSFIFSIYLVFIFSCRESLLSLTRELQHVEESTTSHDGRVDCNIKTSCLGLHVKVICFQRMQTALADERGVLVPFWKFILDNLEWLDLWCNGGFSLQPCQFLPLFAGYIDFLWWRRCLVFLPESGLKCNCYYIRKLVQLRKWQLCRWLET